ncbi:NitT/TauT family transport system ATP-binding protein [Parvibaculum indicum]|uniref:ABC transporter ATP-binding protein n=1 Tax=Parvibaculum indicum TaxID=562969 RepID=UPI00141FCFAE|nr:ABC transporter ATP-binding protein [Parvibaculum indicum]NIJ42462.1 NitT/TauT family transport system ATP-binding protein [Parvibaculum indicum]
MSEATSSPLISLDRVGKTYASGIMALGGVSAEIAQGSFVSLVGPSGCGKSTLLRILAGLISADSGAVAWPATGARPAELGFVFQEATLMPWASVFDNVWLPLKLKGRSREQAHERVMSALSRVSLADFADAFPRELSGGMRMRVSIARALVTEPPLLLMDEPFAALDEFTRETLDDDLLALWHAQAWTVVFVTHSIYEAVYLSQRVLVMGARPGRIVADVKIDAPAERGRDFRESHLYIDQCAAISAKLREAS